MTRCSLRPPLHIQAAFHDRVRAATRKSIIQLAAKSAMLELDPGGRMPADAHADRMAIALRAFAEKARDTVRDAVGEARDRLQALEGAVQVRVLLRMTEDDYFWASVAQLLAARFQALVNAPVTVADWDPLPPEDILRLAVVGSASARAHLPGLSDRFDQLGAKHQRQVAAARPSEFFVPKVIEFLHTAPNWETGGQIGRLLMQHATFLSLETLTDALIEWYDNDQCRLASAMPGLAVQLVLAAAHLGVARGPLFADFAAKCEESAGEGDYYSYPELKATLDKVGLNSPPATNDHTRQPGIYTIDETTYTNG